MCNAHKFTHFLHTNFACNSCCRMVFDILMTTRTLNARITRPHRTTAGLIQVLVGCFILEADAVRKQAGLYAPCCSVTRMCPAFPLQYIGRESTMPTQLSSKVACSEHPGVRSPCECKWNVFSIVRSLVNHHSDESCVPLSCYLFTNTTEVWMWCVVSLNLNCNHCKNERANVFDLERSATALAQVQ